jgi:3-hydroxybutyryl-CoA dehydrogenase
LENVTGRYQRSVEIRKVGVVGGGLMGSGIAEVCARSGHEVVIKDLDQERSDIALERIDRSLSRAVTRGKATPEERVAILERIRPITETAGFAHCDLVIEAVPENLEEKKKVFTELDRVLGPEAIIATNSSSLCVLEMAAVTNRGDRVLGTHFFYPVPIMRLVELVRTILTADRTMSIAEEFAASLGKETIVAKDRPGYVNTRLVIPFLLDAVRVYEEGLSSREDIDTALFLGMNHPMGPLTLIDFFGLDTLLFISDGLYEEFKDHRFAAPTLLRRMVTLGHLGRKTGRGFYEYGQESQR